MTPLRSLLFTLLFQGGSVILSALSVVGLVIYRPVGAFFVRTWSHYHRWLCRHVLGQRIVLEGELADAPVLYVLKHESAFETIEMPGRFANPAVFAKAELFRIPIWGAAGRRFGVIPVERDAGARAMRDMLDAARKALADGRPLCLFAEGTRVLPGERPPLKPGFAGLYLQLKVPVVPVAVDAGHVYGAGLFGKRPGTIRMRVGETIPPGLPRRVAEARVHAAINALNDPLPPEPAD